MAKDKSQVYVATESGTSEIKGEAYVFVRDVTRVREGHPLLKAVPDYFKPVEDGVHYEVEQATKAPGEKRGAAAKPAPAPEPEGENKGPTKGLTTQSLKGK